MEDGYSRGRQRQAHGQKPALYPTFGTAHEYEKYSISDRTEKDLKVLELKRSPTILSRLTD